MQPTTVSLILDANGKPTSIYNYAHITGQATTLVKSGNTFLHSITFNKPTATGVVTIDDALTATTPTVGIITTPASPIPVTLIYDVYLTTGLTIVTGTADQDITVSYR